MISLTNLILEGRIEYPAGYEPAREVPYGGGACSNCAKWNPTSALCEGKYFIEYNGSGNIPTEPERYICNWWVKIQ